MKIYSFVYILIMLSSSCKESVKNDDTIKTETKSFNDYPFDTLIRNQKTALAIAEPILYSIYGEEDVKSKMPYHCYIEDGYWHVYVSSAQKPGAITFGGTHGIILNAKNSEVVSLIRTK